ncbi:MAG: hypothetical protein O8C63_13640 [Candidatus Methanoperedens sp.]|nr:hypothetical protein [Candidatus Methanoperedens sp.]
MEIRESWYKKFRPLKRRNNKRRMLETAEERVKLLKAGFVGKTIEKLYIESNSFKIVRTPAIIELVELGPA